MDKDLLGNILRLPEEDLGKICLRKKLRLDITTKNCNSRNNGSHILYREINGHLRTIFSSLILEAFGVENQFKPKANDGDSIFKIRFSEN